MYLNPLINIPEADGATRRLVFEFEGKQESPN